MKELNMPSGGRPVYTEDFQTLQNEISIFERIFSQNGNNCVLSGCAYVEYPNPGGQTYSASVSEGYAIINGKICHVNAWHNTTFSHSDLPLRIELIQSDSVERAQLVNGENAPLTIDYEGIVRTNNNVIEGAYILMNKKKSSTSSFNDRFTYFYDTYSGFTKKAEVEDVTKRAYIIDLQDYIRPGSVLPTLNATFVYGRHIVQPCSFTISNNNDASKFGSLAAKTYYVFCIRHLFSSDNIGAGNDYLLYDWSGNFVNQYDANNVLPCIRDVFGESIATNEQDGRMSKEYVRSLNRKADRSYVDVELAKKMSSDATYNKQQIDDALETKLDYNTWKEDKDILWGEIKMWAGRGAPPEKYHLCDGSYFPIPASESDEHYDLWKAIDRAFNTDATPANHFALPNLSGRFIVGRGTNSNNETFNYRTSGGAATVTLTTDQIPAHRHTVPSDDWNNGGTPPYSQYGIENYKELNYGPGESGAGGVCDSGPAGGGQPHNNLPPYYVLAYVIRVSK